MHNFVWKYIIFNLIACITTSSSERDEFPTINDIFKSLSEDPTEETITKPPDVVVRNIDINLETLNMSNFREKIDGYSKAFSTNTTDDSNMLVKEFNSRRLAWAGGNADWKRASKVLVYTKLYDLMLQTIYMARHKIKQVENDPYYNPTETSYRIAFLYRNLLRLNRRVMDAYTTMKRNRGKGWRLGRFLILHHRVAKLHVDFLYLWWVMVRLNERYEYRHGIPNSTPRPGMQWRLGRFLILHHRVAKLHVDFLYLWWVMVRLNERYEYRHGIPNTTPRPGMYYYPP